MVMKIAKNLGMLDRVLRLGASSGFVYIGFFDNPLVEDPIIATALGLFGVANVVVALVGNCPLYTLINFSTYKHQAS